MNPEGPPPRCRCGKLSYETRAEAERIVRAMVGQARGGAARAAARRRGRAMYPANTLHAYACTWIARGTSAPSGAWHVGNDRGAR